MQLGRKCHVVLSSQLEPAWTLILLSSLLLARGIASLGALNSNLCDRNDSHPGCRAWTVGGSLVSSLLLARGIASLGALTALAASTQHTVASMLLKFFPCVRLDCVSSASKTCLDYVWSVNVFILSV